MQQINIWLEPEQIEALQDYADDNALKRGQVIRMAVQQFINEL